MIPPDALLAEMSAHGVAPAENLEIVADDDWHDFQVAGDRPGRKNGRYICDGSIPLHVSFGSWKTGEWYSWREARDVNSVEALAQRKRQAEQRRIREQEQAEKYRAAAARAVQIWNDSRPASAAHPYLRIKSVRRYGVRQRGGLLVVPMRNAEGQVQSLQFINPDGGKTFLTGGRASGSFFVIGERTPQVWLCEGFATGASLHEEFGECVVVAFSARYLLPVAQEIRRTWGAIDLVIMADDDQKTPGNPGHTAAKEAGAAVGCRVVLPKFPPGHGGGGDFNDAVNAWRSMSSAREGARTFATTPEISP
ncbi:MAG: toprim domain-containing protein [Gammaproteobacteria bacterium]|nr:toprim domain-containing protein [Gammaproteobacteria bacterium]